jgi:hypothetical protein
VNNYKQEPARDHTRLLGNDLEGQGARGAYEQVSCPAASEVNARRHSKVATSEPPSCRGRRRLRTHRSILPRVSQ